VQLALLRWNVFADDYDAEADALIITAQVWGVGHGPWGRFVWRCCFPRIPTPNTLPSPQLDAVARIMVDAMDGLKSVATVELDAVCEVTALRRTVSAMRTQVARVSGALLELEELRVATAALREEVTLTVAREIEPLREWFNIYGAGDMAEMARLRRLEGQAVEAAMLTNVGLASTIIVPDRAFTISGAGDTSFPPHYSRLNNGNGGTRISNARPGVDWVQVALPSWTIVGGLSWQGAVAANVLYQCWRTVSLRVSMDGVVWRDADDGAQFTRPDGMQDQTTHTVTLRVGHLCRFVRLVFHARGSAAAGSEYVRWELRHTPAPPPPVEG
jgi:hypothetical protein